MYQRILVPLDGTSKLLAIISMTALILSACASAAHSANEGKVVEHALTTGMIDGKFTYIGVGGGIDGVSNPVLSANVGDAVKITLTSGDGIEHDISFPDFDATSEHVVGQGSSVTLSFTVDKGGEFAYFCTLPGHREGGMEGKFSVAGGPVANSAPTTSSNEHMAIGGPVVVDNPPTTGADVMRESSFHVIGEIFDRVYDQASLTSPALTDIQTTVVPPGGASVVEFGLEVPGNYLLVDRALSRMQRGLVGYLIAEGPENPDIFEGTLSPGSGH